MATGYFINFPTLQYPYSGKIVESNAAVAYVNTVEATDLMLRYKIRDEIFRNKTAFYTWTWNAGDRPDVIAAKYYGDPRYAWVVMYSAKCYDGLFEFPMSEYELAQKIDMSYTCLKLDAALSTGDFWRGEKLQQTVGGTVVFSATFIDYDPTKEVVGLTNVTGDYQIGVPIVGVDSGETSSVLAPPVDNFNFFGSTSVIHHYETSDGFIIDRTAYDALSPNERKTVTIYTYEYNKNETNRKIKLLGKSYLLQFVKEFENQITDIEEARAKSTIKLVQGGRG